MKPVVYQHVIKDGNENILPRGGCPVLEGTLMQPFVAQGMHHQYLIYTSIANALVQCAMEKENVHFPL